MSKELKIGIFAIIVVAAFFWGFNFMKGQDIFQPNLRKFKVEYSNVGGLNESSIVTISGLKVGQVSNIDFNTDLEKRGSLVVEFTVNNDFEFSKKSIVKIYSSNPLAGSSLAIIPSYEGEIAKSGDLLKGEIEPGLLSSIGARLDPIQSKLEHVLVSADTLFQKVSHILNDDTNASIKKSIKGLEHTISDFRKTLGTVNVILDSTSTDLKQTLKNSKSITDNLVTVTDTLANVDINSVVKKTELLLDNVNTLLSKIDTDKGTLGKLLNDDTMYNNLTKASKELEELLREMKLNPKRFVHFSLFGKKPKPYNPDNHKDTIKK